MIFETGIGGLRLPCYYLGLLSWFTFSRGSETGVSREFCKIFKNMFFIEGFR